MGTIKLLVYGLLFLSLEHLRNWIVLFTVIIAGTPAAKGVSVSDMERRLQLEQWKTAKLRNLNMFVSPNRLVIQNLPPNSSDKQLRKLFKKYSGPKSVITEVWGQPQEL